MVPRLSSSAIAGGRGIDAVVAIRAGATGVSLYFNQDLENLPDPKRLLRGSGKQTNFIQVEAASRFGASTT